MLSDGGAHQTSSNATGNVMTHIGQKLSLFIGTIAATAGLLSAVIAARADDNDGRKWTVVGDAGSDKDISGAACAPDGRCLLVSDEKHRAWFFTRDETDPANPRMIVGERIKLTPHLGGDESDAEAAAFDHGHFYAIGSHGTARKKKEFEPSRYSIYRIEPDGSVLAKGTLAEILAATPGIREDFCTKTTASSCKALQDGGANIEGLAVRDQQMYVGFRAPSPDGEAFIVRVAEGAVFGTDDPNLKVFRLKLGQDAIHRSLGIRDLAAVSDGFLVLAGPALPEEDGSPGSGAAFHWREDGTLTKLRDVGLRQDGIKPEVLLLLGITATSYRIVVMHDGVPGGSPLEYQISKP
jgi:hypothetical protein